MSSNKNKIIYFIATGLLTLLLLFSISMYIFNYKMVKETFINLGHPTYIIYPLAIAELLGLYAIWFNKTVVREWAYTGFFFNFVIALSAHMQVDDGNYLNAIIAIVLLMVSYFYGNKLLKQGKNS